MAKVFVFHYTEAGRLPKLSEKELRDIMKGFYVVLKGYPDVKFNGTYGKTRAGWGFATGGLRMRML